MVDARDLGDRASATSPNSRAAMSRATCGRGALRDQLGDAALEVEADLVVDVALNAAAGLRKVEQAANAAHALSRLMLTPSLRPTSRMRNTAST